MTVPVDDLRITLAEWSTRVRARSDSAVGPLMSLLLRQPVISTTVMPRALSQVGNRRRSILWASSPVLAAPDGFPARTGRRRLGDLRLDPVQVEGLRRERGVVDGGHGYVAHVVVQAGVGDVRDGLAGQGAVHALDR